MCLSNFKYVLFLSNSLHCLGRTAWCKNIHMCPLIWGFSANLGVCVLFQVSLNRMLSFTCSMNCSPAVLQWVFRVSSEAVPRKGQLISLSQGHSQGFWLLLLQVCVIVAFNHGANGTQTIPTSERKFYLLKSNKILFRRGLQGLFGWKRVFFGVGVNMNEIKA